MKRNSQAGLIILLILLSSCSNLTTRKSLFGDEGQSSDDSKVTTVPKSQYDQLLKKYEILLKQNRDANINGRGEDVPAVDKDLFNEKRPEDIVSALNQLEGKQGASGGADLAETVDVFKKPVEPKGLSTKQPVVIADYDKIDMEGQIKKYRQAVVLMNQNKFDAALNEFKLLENSPVRQISVRAKFNIGELLFKQGEFDLAMQVYEEILQKDAFSGLVLKALGRLIVCSAKLKLKKKEEQYYSVLHDFFEQS